MERTVLFADVVLPLAVDGTFTYRVPLELNDDVAVGKRVVVQFGQKKVYAALVFKIHTKAPEHYTVKYILGVLDSRPVVFESQYRLWEWMSFYYHATLGEVMNAALPSAFKLASETQVILNPDFDGDFSVLSDTEYLITEALTLRNILSLTEITKITGQLKTFNLIKSLIEKGVILVEEGLKEKFRPRKETLIRLSDVYKEEDALRSLFDILEKKAPKQFMLLLRYIQLAQKEGDMFSAVSRKTLLSDENFTASALDGMCKKNIFEAISEDVSRLSSYNQPLAGSLALSESQQLALEEINKQFETHTTVLLHGITSSGKTEIYVKLIEEQLQQGKQVLYLLPEIALTTQMITRLRKFFGNDIGVYHSRFNDRERIEIWNAVLHNDAGPRFNIILGARSALLLPFSNLGLIIVDEEHEVSYKQHFPAPFYNARDTAVYMGLHLGCKVLLGSATPSIESYYNSENGKFGRVNLMRRFNDLPMPEFEVVDMADLYKKKALKSFFSPRLLQNIETCLNNKEQVILFQNRRGFALWIECQNCHYIPGCPYCDVTLTYHKKTNDLKCHCCGHKTIVPDKCPACTSPKILMKSYGTERVEDELSIIYPKARIARMDLDTTRTKNALQDIINDFEDNRFDILVGTQMLGKGMDFGNVGLVGVLNADNLLNFPDFRSFERAFQLVSQVSGRTGRKNKRGKVVLQTYNPGHFVIESIVKNDYRGFYEEQILERRKFFYPPFTRLIHLSLKHRNRDTLDKAASLMAKILREHLPKRILGPEYPHVSKVRNEFVKDILIKTEKAITAASVREILSKEIFKIKTMTEFRGIKCIVDVDPI